MTLQELERTLPNGLHGAEISKLEIDYVARVARLHLALLVGVPEDPAPERDRMAPALLELTGLLFVVSERPDSRYPYGDPSPIRITSSDDLGPFGDLPPESFGTRLFIEHWNAFMHIAARAASLTWLSEDGPAACVRRID